MTAAPGLLDCVNNWGSLPWRVNAVGLPQPILDCPQFADKFFESVQGKVLKFCMTGSQAVNEGMQACCILTKARKNVRIACSVWYATDEM